MQGVRKHVGWGTEEPGLAMWWLVDVGKVGGQWSLGGGEDFLRKNREGILKWLLR